MLSAAYSYHNHSLWSDGIATIPEMVSAARAAGLREFGMSDHYVLTPYAGTDVGEWSMAPEELPKYVAEVLEVAGRESTENFVVRLGLEVDYFPETCGELDERLGAFPFDYIVGSVHSVDGFPIDSSADFWTPLSQDEVDAVYSLYWRRMLELAQAGFCDFVGHLDLPKKFGFFPSRNFEAEIEAVLDAIAAADIAMELNAAGWNKTCAACYPTPEILAKACQREIPVLISADAHSPECVANHYPLAAEVLWKAGFRETVRFDKRERFSVPLA